MNVHRPRFSILHLLEATAVLAISLAVGRAVVADYVSLRDAAANGQWFVCFAPPVLPQLLTGGIGGAYLGIRWFRSNPLLWCALKSSLLGGLLVAASLVSLFTVDLAKVPLDILLRPEFIVNIALDLSRLGLWGGIFSGCISLLLVGLLKFIARQQVKLAPIPVPAEPRNGWKS